MNRPDSTASDTPPEQLLKIRQTLVDRLWKGLFIVTLIAVPVSVSRYFFTGWLHLYSFHVASVFSVVALYWFRDKVPFPVKSALVVFTFWAVGVTGVFSLGMLGVGYWWLVLSSLLVSTLYSVRAGIVNAAVVTVLLVIAGAGFISGTLDVAVDANSYIASIPAWGALLMATIVTPFVVFQAIAAYQQTTLALLDEVHKQRDQIEQFATHDQLTGLPLPHLAADRLQMALNAAHRSGKKVALLFIDLDGFKSVNDTLGHDVGDHVLKEIANRISKTIRTEDTAARIGGDEFIVILGGLPDPHVAARIAGRTIHAISAPIDCAGGQTSVGASIGISLFPDHANDAKSLRRKADAAMYAVKRSGKNRFAFAERESMVDTAR